MIKRFLVSGVVGLFLFSIIALPAHAVELTLPSVVSNDGLSWDIQNQQLATMNITTTPDLSVAHKPKSDSLTDIILSPAPGQTSTSTQTATPTPAPTPPIVPQLEISLTAVEVTPSPTPIPSPTQTPDSQLSNPGGLNADTLFSMVNNYRASNNLPVFQKNDQVCQVAQTRAPEVSNEVATGTMHAGLKAMNLPYWNTENIISMNSEAAAFNWWLNDPIHHAAIVGNFTYSCAACSGDSCAEEFTNFQPK